MKTQEELAEKLRKELLDKYRDDENRVNDINDCIERKDYAELINSYDVDSVRICSECGKLMDEGFCISDGLEYYCSEECLTKNMTLDEYYELYDDGNGDSYWTEWEY